MRRLFIALLFSLIANAALAQNPTCPTRPPGDTSNACASTGFVNGGGLGPGIVTNSNLANMAAGTAKCNPAGGSASAPRDCSQPVVNAVDYGATGNGSTDDTTAIQNAINALPASGGTVLFPVGNYKVSSTLNVGNGTSSVASSKLGVFLVGVGNPHSQPIFGGFTATAGPKITWAGSGSNPIISVNGPLQGWGIQNLYLDCASIASSVGLSLTSSQYGDNSNLTINNCFRGIVSQTVPTFGSFSNTDSIHNSWRNLTVNVPATAGSLGIFLTGNGTNNTSNTDYCDFYNTDIDLPTSVVAVTGIAIQDTDSCVFKNTHIYGGNASSTAVSFDYTATGTSGTFPASNMFYGIDVGSLNGTAFGVTGTPGSNAKPNYLYGLVETNGAVNPKVSNLNPALPVVVSPGISLTGQTATIGGQGVTQPPNVYLTGMYRLNYYLEITTTGNAVNVSTTLGWTDDAQAQTLTSALIAANAKNFTQGSVIIRATAATNITYATTVSGAIGTGLYSLYIRLEKLD